eukprot:XP_001706566.1 Hypothetical protein GL50803_8548 [Giardia lamblia ATCC 50803]
MDLSDCCDLLLGSCRGLSLSAAPPRQLGIADIIQKDENTTEAEKRSSAHGGPQGLDPRRGGTGSWLIRDAETLGEEPAVGP